MAKVEIYTKDTCPYCVRAKALLDSKNVTYTEHSLTQDMSLRDGMIKRAEGRSTVPQVFIDDIGYGGCDDLHALESLGRLNQLLGL